MKKTISIGNTTIKPGTKGHGVLSAPDALADGSPVEVPFTIINGSKPGPTLHLQVGAHAFEIQGLEAIRRVFAEIDPKKLSGTLQYCLPNPIALRERRHHLVLVNRQPILGYVQLINVNRIWPGRPNGTIMERLVNAIWTNMIKDKADCVIDYHTRGGWGEGIANWVAYQSEPKTEELAKIYGTEYLCSYPPVKKEAPTLTFDKPLRVIEELQILSIQGLCVSHGIPSFAPEGGYSGFVFQEEVIGIDARGIKNVMKQLGMIEGKPELPKNQFLMDREAFRSGAVVANKGGFVVPTVTPKQEVKKGEILGRIYSIRTLESVETLMAPTDGIVWYLPEFPIIESGESIMGVLDLSRAKIIENP